MIKMGALMIVLNRTEETEAPAIVTSGPDEQGKYGMTVFDDRGATPLHAVAVCPSHEAAWERESLTDPHDGIVRKHLVHDRGSIYVAYPLGADEAAGEDAAAAEVAQSGTLAEAPAAAPAPAPAEAPAADTGAAAETQSPMFGA